MEEPSTPAANLKSYDGYRSLHRLAPDYIRSRFEKRESAYNERDPDNKLNVPLPRTNYYNNSFSYSGATLWNSLSCDVKQAENLGQFKRERHGICGKQLFISFYINIVY